MSLQLAAMTARYVEFDFTRMAFDTRVSFSRSGDGTCFDAAGAMQTATSNTPRIDHDPVTGEVLGLLIEEQRTNLLLNSASLSTQAVTVTATQYAISFYGTGTITLSGAYSGTINGAGAFPARAELVFTPSAGALTVSVSGSVQYAQLEAGYHASSYIPTTSATVTRAADVATLPEASYRWSSASGTLYAEGVCRVTADTAIGDGAYGLANLMSIGSGYMNGLRLGRNDQTSRFARSYFYARQGGATYAAESANNLYVPNALTRAAFAYGSGAYAAAMNGATVLASTASAVAPPTSGDIGIGRGDAAVNLGRLNGTIRRLRYYQRKLTDAELLAVTA